VRIGYFIPAYRQDCHIEVAMDLARGVSWLGTTDYHGAQVVPFWVDATGIARARNLAVDIAYKHEFDALVMQDADCFTPGPTSTLEQLFTSLMVENAAVVGAAIAIRNGAGMNCDPAEPGALYEGDVGTGLMMIDLRRLRALPRPWFVHRDTPDGLTVARSEDIYFCQHVRAHGHRALVDYTFPTGHASTGVVGTAPPAVTGVLKKADDGPNGRHGDADLRAGTRRH
jgi:hypothetical protein